MTFPSKKKGSDVSCGQKTITQTERKVKYTRKRNLFLMVLDPWDNTILSVFPYPFALVVPTCRIR